MLGFLKPKKVHFTTQTKEGKREEVDFNFVLDDGHCIRLTVPRAVSGDI
jgi:hypothetical protein